VEEALHYKGLFKGHVREACNVKEGEYLGIKRQT